MFFGMCNSPATFQAMMDEIFKKEIEENLIIVYMDDFPKQLMVSRKSNKLYWRKHGNMTYISKPRSANSENQKLNILVWLSKKENWQWIPPNLKEYWTGLHQKQLKKYDPS
jgi:hypothetical protein